jgi:hypothetical protein
MKTSDEYSGLDECGSGDWRLGTICVARNAYTSAALFFGVAHSVFANQKCKKCEKYKLYISLMKL